MYVYIGRRNKQNIRTEAAAANEIKANVMEPETPELDR